MLQREFYRLPDGNFYGLWWAEYGGALDSIHDDGQVLWHTRRLIYGLWDYIKNSGKFANVERLEIDWIGVLPGKRESRRLMGPLVLTANDFLAQREFEDRIGFAGWAVDIHPPHGYQDPEPACTHEYLPGITDIPFRCLYSRNVPNLLFAGRDISVSHEGLGVLRVIATTAVMGQAVGTAAALALRKALSIGEFACDHINELQRELATNDQSIIGYRLMHPDDISRTCSVDASSTGPLACEEAVQWFTLNGKLGLALPADSEGIGKISFMIKSNGPKTFEMEIFRADKPQNYRFHERIAKCREAVDRTGWVSFSVKALPGEGKKLFMVFGANANVQIGCQCNEPAPGIFGFTVAAKAPHQVEDRKGEIGSGTAFNLTPLTPVFRIEPGIKLWEAVNAIDGYIRPHGLPHCWTSGRIDVGNPVWIRLRPEKPVLLERAELVFNSGLNIRRHDQKGIYPRLAKDYDIIAETAEGDQVLVRVRENIQRFRRHYFTPVKVQAVRLIIYQSWGASEADLFDFRIYQTSLR